MQTPEYPRDPDFGQFLKVLRREEPDRPTLFEFYLHPALYERLAGRPAPWEPGPVSGHETAGARGTGADRAEMLGAYRALGRWYADAFAAAGYDYVNFGPALAFPDFVFRRVAHDRARSHSLNEGALITSWEELEQYEWPEASRIDPGLLDALTADLPEGMQALVYTPCGVLENLVDLMGYDELCYQLVDDRELVAAVAAGVGDALEGLYESIVDHPRLGAMIANDDWGFKTQTMISPDDLRKFVYPAYRRIITLSHGAGKPILLHSCGNLGAVMDDIIDDLRFDAKHSFEDVILPAEEVYERWGSRIAILGGIDIGFLCEAGPDAITARSRAMLSRARGRGGYALGSGNSIPDYVPDDAFFAMTRAALET